MADQAESNPGIVSALPKRTKRQLSVCRTTP
jgi:hypothetical protein